MAATLTRIAYVRAAVITFALVVHGIPALPLPRSIKRSQFDTPMASEEMARWSRLVGSVGIDRSASQLSDLFFAMGTVAVDARKMMVAPFARFYRVSGTGQGWGLFTYPDSFPHQLCVDIRREGGGWEQIYAGLDPTDDWHRPQLVYRRIRGVYDGSTEKPGITYTNFVSWVSGEAFADFPDAEAVRVSFLRAHNTRPGEPQDPEKKRRWERVKTRKSS